MRIDLVFYPDRIRRFLRISSRRLRSMLRMPRTTELPEVKRPADTERLILDARAELKRVTDTVPRRQHRVQPLNPAPRAVEASATEPVKSATQPKQAAVPPAGAPAHDSKAQRPVEVCGFLDESGVGTRRMHKRSFEQFFIKVRVDDLNGEPVQMWGADLQRALRESGATVGDRITVKHLGMVPCIVPEEVTQADGGVKRSTRPSSKNVYVIEKHQLQQKEKANG